MEKIAEVKDQTIDALGVATPLGGSQKTHLNMIDRSLPDWAKFLSYFFALGTGFCIVALMILTVYFQTLVISDGIKSYSPVLTLFGIVPILGLIVFEFAHARALSGYKFARLENEKAAHAGLAVIVFSVLTIVHPFIGLAIPSIAAVNFLITKYTEKRAKREKLWDFRKEEAVSILSGRDNFGRRLASKPATNHPLSKAILFGSVGLSFVASLGLSSWFAASEITNTNAVFGIALLSAWATYAIAIFVRSKIRLKQDFPTQAQSVVRLPTRDIDETGTGPQGLNVQGLTVSNAQGVQLLSDVSFRVAPGSIVGLIGEIGGGKTLLQQAICDPFALLDMNVRGRITYNETDLWERSKDLQTVPALAVEAVPYMLPTSGANNLACFHSGSFLERGKRVLEQMVFSADAVDEICNIKDARFLPTSSKKALGFARAFLLGPSMYFFDRPEDGASDKLLSAFIGRIQSESNAGRSFILASDNRAVLEMCNSLLVLQQGRIVDFGPAEEIRNRMSSGWARFVSARQLDAEENLETWIRSHFKRDGDEANRRKVCTAAAEMLALSCQTVDALHGDTVSYEFKHFEGYCLLRMRDHDALISSGVLQRASEESETKTGRKTPLSRIIGEVDEFDQTIEHESRVITVKIETYDPRKSQQRGATLDATASV